MRTDFRDLVIDEAIVHVVPQRARDVQDQQDIQLSESICELTQAVHGELLEKSQVALEKQGRQVVEDPEVKSPLPDWVRDFLHQRQDLLAVSGQMARHLLDCQTTQSPAGFLMVASCRLDGKTALLLVKLEQETGVQVDTVIVNGLRTVDMQFFSNLLFADKSRVYKVALFSTEGDHDQGLEGWAADKQGNGRKLAGYFRKDFLGTDHKNDPRDVTLQFHDKALQWVNTAVDDPRTRVDYTMAVMVELQSRSTSLSPSDFAEKHLYPNHRTSFVDYLKGQEIPVRIFDKNTEFVETKLQMVRMEFADGVFIVAPLQAINDEQTRSITVKPLDYDHTQVTVTGVLANTTSFANGARRNSKAHRGADQSA